MSENFEQLLDQYKSIADKLENNELNFVDSIKIYEESNEIYKKLNTKIEEAKQKIINVRQQ